MSDDKTQAHRRMAEETKDDTVGRAYHLRRANEETGRADRGAQSGARSAHRGLAKLHRDRADNSGRSVLLIVTD